jgi:hypothetical protein
MENAHRIIHMNLPYCNNALPSALAANLHGWVISLLNYITQHWTVNVQQLYTVFWQKCGNHLMMHFRQRVILLQLKLHAL